MPVSGLSFATSTLVGQNIGACKPKRCIRATMYASYIAFFITIVFFILITFSPRTVLSVFSNDPVVLSSGIWPLIIFAFNQILFAQSIIFDAPLLGTGYLKIWFLCSICINMVLPNSYDLFFATTLWPKWNMVRFHSFRSSRFSDDICCI